MRAQIVSRLSDPIYRNVETSGQGDPADFAKILNLVDGGLHEKYTGSSNHLILRNAEILKASGVPFIVRIPLMGGINDGVDNLGTTAAFLSAAQNLLVVELLPYNTMAGAKYAMLGMQYESRFPPKCRNP